MTNTPSPAVEVTQADRDAATALGQLLGVPDITGPRNQDAIAKAFARHRLTPLPTRDEPTGREFMDANDLALWRSINKNCQDGHDRAGVNHNTLRRLLNTVDYWRNAALSTPTTGEASAPPPLSEQTLTAGAGHAPSSAAESGAGARETLEAIDKFITSYFEPWGSWKAAWWEGEVSDDAAFSDGNALKHVANKVRQALGGNHD